MVRQFWGHNTARRVNKHVGLPWGLVAHVELLKFNPKEYVTTRSSSLRRRFGGLDCPEVF